MSQTPSSPMNPLSTLLSSVELVQKAWPSFNLPPQFAPTMDVKELDKRLTDLKAVEQWLTLNLKMLHGTIEGLEMQRNAIAAINEFGKSAEPAQAPAASVPPVAASQPDATAWWNLLQSQFNQIADAALRSASPQGLTSAAATKAPKARKAKAASKSEKSASAK